MLVSDLVSYSMRVSGILGVGQVALPQDTADAQTALSLMIQQWRQKRWLVFRLNWSVYPLLIGKQSYTVGPVPASGTAPDFETDGDWRPANIQSCYLRQNVGSGPNSYPIDFPMRILKSRQEYDRISLKFLQSWPAAIYYDPTIPNATLNIWPIPVQHLFSLYLAWQEDLWATIDGTSVEIEDFLPAETEEALIYNLALRLCTNYKMPPDPALAAAARASLNTLRQTNFALQTLRMPQSLRPGTRLKNPMAGFYPEVSAGVAVTSLG
jgi:hypothetical protein